MLYRLHHVHRADDIRHRIADRLLDALRDAHLCRLTQDVADPLARTIARRGTADIPLMNSNFGLSWNPHLASLTGFYNSPLQIFLTDSCRLDRERSIIKHRRWIMSLTEYSFRLLLLFLPGIIAFIIIDNLTIHQETKTQHRIIYSLLLGFLSYLLLMIFSKPIQLLFTTLPPMQFIVSLTNKDTQINFTEIFTASIIGVCLGCTLCKAINDRCLFKLAQELRISNKFQETDAWANCIATYHPVWVIIRDREQKIIYQGQLVISSDSSERDGLVLENATVYTENSESIYKTQVIYIPTKMENLIIELI